MFDRMQWIALPLHTRMPPSPHARAASLRVQRTAALSRLAVMRLSSPAIVSLLQYLRRKPHFAILCLNPWRCYGSPSSSNELRDVAHQGQRHLGRVTTAMLQLIEWQIEGGESRLEGRSLREFVAALAIASEGREAVLRLNLVVSL